MPFKPSPLYAYLKPLVFEILEEKFVREEIIFERLTSNDMIVRKINQLDATALGMFLY